MFVPGVLQTEEYASVVLQAFYEEKFAAERVTALVDLCVRRRDLPTGENAPKLSFILEGYRKLSSASFRGSPSNC
jgi:hypothetical protein